MPWPDFFFRSKTKPSTAAPSKAAPPESKETILDGDKAVVAPAAAFPPGTGRTTKRLPGARVHSSAGSPTDPTQPFPVSSLESKSESDEAPSPVTFRRKAKLTDVARLVPPTAPPPDAAPAVDSPKLSEAAPVFSVPSAPAVNSSQEIISTPPVIDSPPPVEVQRNETPAPVESPVIAQELSPTMPAPEKPSVPTVPEKALVTTDTRPKQEFLLTNGERILGHILSETPEAIYINHGSLGVLTIQRSQIAKRLVEIILINGDRIVGDVMAETADSLYIRHASLGMITVPRAQRSTHVVEAVLKDGDRILGEVLAETETFTVLRSATLGTVTVKHEQVTMLNRKVEQIRLKSLPSSENAGGIEDRSATSGITPPASNPTMGTDPATSSNP